MPTLTLKNVPGPLYRRLKEQAGRNHRSLNREALHCLEEAAGEAAPGSGRIDAQAFLEEVRRSREAMAERGVWLTGEGLQQAIEKGRP